MSVVGLSRHVAPMALRREPRYLLNSLFTFRTKSKSSTFRTGSVQRILVRIKEHCEAGQYQSATDAENEFRRLVESDLACK